jgi:hypothetical protein
MKRDMLRHCHDERDLCLYGFFNGLCCLIAGDIDRRCIRLCSLLGLSSSAHSFDLPIIGMTNGFDRWKDRQTKMFAFNSWLHTTNNLRPPG